MLMLIFQRTSPSLLYGSTPVIYPQHRHMNSDDFGGHLVLRIEDQERNISNTDRRVIGLEIANIVYHLFKRMGSHTYKIVKSFLISLSPVPL